MSLPIKAELLIDLGNWQKGLTKASKQMTGFGKSMKTVANGVKAAWAGIALVGIGQVYDAIVDVTKAAADDNKSMALLNAQMKKTWGGNETLNKSINDQIDAMSNATGILDDDLRPALIRIAAVTKSPVKGMKMLGLSADIAAKQGLDLNAVSKAMAKFLGGNKIALDRMIPGLRESGDRMGYLTKNYKGFAEIAGKNDPFGRINVTVENFKEKLGQAFLPLANSFADWLAGPEAQRQLDAIADRVKEAFAWLNSSEGQKTIKEWYDRTKAVVDLIIGAVDGLLEFINSMPGSKSEGQKAWEEKTSKGGTSFYEPGSGDVRVQGYWSAAKEYQASTMSKIKTENTLPPVVQNITVNGVVSGKEVIDALNKQARSRGLKVNSLFL
jgi:hypothetical protein